MTILKLIEEIKAKNLWETGFKELEELLSELQIPEISTSDYYWSEVSTEEQRTAFENRFKSAWIRKHYCTDSWVGAKLYWFDDILIGYSNQEGRKCSLNMDLFESALPTLELIKTEILKLVGSKEIRTISDEEFGFETEMDKGYTVDYCSQLLTKTIYRNDTDEELTVTDSRLDYYLPSKEWSNVKVRDSKGEEYTYSLNDCYIPWGY